jgi:hypothetical protein
MTFEEAIALQPAWLGLWLNWLFFGAFVLPVSLLIWRQSRFVAVVSVVCSVVAGGGVYWLYGQLGYVKLLGLPHILIWTPLAAWLLAQMRRADMPVWPRRIIGVVLATILISLVFDYVDAVRYIMGERTPLAMPA